MQSAPSSSREIVDPLTVATMTGAARFPGSSPVDEGIILVAEAVLAGTFTCPRACEPSRATLEMRQSVKTTLPMLDGSRLDENWVDRCIFLSFLGI